MPDLSPEQRAALARRVAAQRAATRAAPIPPRPAGTPVPLSSRQRSLWLVDALGPGTTAYNHVIALDVVGPLSTQSLCDAFRAVIVRHEALRSTVRVDDDGRPWADIKPVTALDVDIDVRRVPAEAAEGELRRAALRPFDLGADLPVRLLVLEHDSLHSTIGVLGHHIALDNRSAAVVIDELFALYDVTARGRTPPTEPLLQYGDLVVWEERMVDASATERLTQWWRDHLDGVDPVLTLPTDRPRANSTTHAGARSSIDLSAVATAAAREAARRSGVTEYVWFLTSFAATLARWSGQRSFAIGTPYAGRERAELVDVVGFVNNTLVVPVRVDAATTWRDLLDTTRTAVLGAFEHAALGVAQVVEAVAPPRDLSRNPLFQTNFRIAPPVSDEFTCADLRIRRVHVDLGYSKFDFSFELHSRDDSIAGHAEYATSLFDASTVHAVIATWQSIVDAVLEDPSIPIAALPRPASQGPRPKGRAVRRRE